MKAWFRGIAAAFASEAAAQSLAGISVLLLTLYGGMLGTYINIFHCIDPLS